MHGIGREHPTPLIQLGYSLSSLLGAPLAAGVTHTLVWIASQNPLLTAAKAATNMAKRKNPKSRRIKKIRIALGGQIR
jgi:hypothetical protein